MQIEHDLQDLLDAITDVSGRTAITDALNKSSELLTMYNNLADRSSGAQKVTKIEWNSDPNDKTGFYQAGVLHMGLGWVVDNGAINPSALALLMGHEGQHGLDDKSVSDADSQFADEVVVVAKSGGTQPHDYTSLLQANQQAHLNDEGKADISGCIHTQGQVLCIHTQGQVLH